MTNHSDAPYQDKPDPRADTKVSHSHCAECGEAPCACPAKGRAPRITCEDIDMAVATARRVDYFRFPYTTMTVCCLVLANGFAVVGKSAAVSEDNFDAEIGRKVALEDAENQLWSYLGFRLKQALWEQEDKAEMVKRLARDVLDREHLG